MLCALTATTTAPVRTLLGDRTSARTRFQPLWTQAFGARAGTRTLRKASGMLVGVFTIAPRGVAQCERDNSDTNVLPAMRR